MDGRGQLLGIGVVRRLLGLGGGADAEGNAVVAQRRRSGAENTERSDADGRGSHAQIGGALAGKDERSLHTRTGWTLRQPGRAASQRNPLVYTAG